MKAVSGADALLEDKGIHRIDSGRKLELQRRIGMVPWTTKAMWEEQLCWQHTGTETRHMWPTHCALWLATRLELLLPLFL